MNSQEAQSSSKPAEIAQIDHAAWTFALGEVFVLIPLHAFWMLFKCTPFVAENTPSALVAAVPLGVMLVAGLAMRLGAIRAAIVRLEWLLHLTASACTAALLLYIALRDPFSPGVPITWPLCFWSVCIAFTLLSNLALHERTHRYWLNTVHRPKLLYAIGAAFALWCVLAWVAAGMAWAPYFLSVSIAFHAVMAPLSGRRAKVAPAIPRGRRLTSVAAFAEGMMVTALMLTALLRLIFTCQAAGTAEVRYFEFVGVCANPWFLAGALVALLAARLRLAFVALAVVLVNSESAAWPISYAMGYGLPVLFLAGSRQGGLGLALSAAAASAMWLLGALAFMVAGLMILSGIGLDFAKGLAANMRVATLVLYVAYLVMAGTNWWWFKRRATPATADALSVRRPVLALTYAAIWVAVLVPIMSLAMTAMWPPIRFERAVRIEVGEPSGVCHAGYSRSDEEYADLDALGVRLMRVDFHWRRIQPAAETWDFGHFDAYVDAAQEHGVNVLALLDFDNNAVEQSPAGSQRDKYVAPEDVPLFLEYVRRTVDRYKDRVYAWEIWNEPDSSRFWPGPMEEFYALARQTADTVRRVHPTARLLGTAMTSPFGVSVAKGVEGIHTSGASRLVDHPTMHTYVSDPRAYYNEFLRVRNAAAKNGHSGSVWVTELGDPDGGVYPWRASSGLLAEHAMKAYTIATSTGIEKLIWYCYRDSRIESLRKAPGNSEGFFGLVGPGGEWKPAAYAYSLFAKHCSNTVIRSDLIVASGGIASRQLRTALYRRADGASALVLWFEPGLRPGAHARAAIDLGALEEPAIMHDIASGYTKHLLDKVVCVTEKPLFITFQAPDSETPVRLEADTSPADVAWLVLLIGLVLWSGLASLHGHELKSHRIL